MWTLHQWSSDATWKVLLMSSSLVAANSTSVVTYYAEVGASEWNLVRPSFKSWLDFMSVFFLFLFFHNYPLCKLNPFQHLGNYSTYKYQTCTSMLVMTCGLWCYQYHKHYLMTQQKSHITSSFSVKSTIIVDIQLHPQLFEATWLTIISCGV